MKIIATWISFAEDSDCLLQSIRYFQKTQPDISCIVIEDSVEPISKKVRKKLQRINVEFVQTNVARSGNLRGLKWLRCQLETQHKLALKHHADIVLKIDSDTLVSCLKRINLALADKSIMASGGSWQGREQGNWICGCLIAIKVAAITRLVTELANVPKWIYSITENAPEDLTTSRLICDLFGERAIKPWPYDARDGFVAGWQYGRSSVTPEYYLKNFDCVTFGNRHLIDAHDKRKAVAREMRKFSKTAIF